MASRSATTCRCGTPTLATYAPSSRCRASTRRAALAKAYGFNATVAASGTPNTIFTCGHGVAAPDQSGAAWASSRGEAERAVVAAVFVERRGARDGLARLKVRRAVGGGRRAAAQLGRRSGGSIDEPRRAPGGASAFALLAKGDGAGVAFPLKCEHAGTTERARGCRPRRAAVRVLDVSPGRSRARRPRPPLPRAAPAEGPGSQKSTAKRPVNAKGCPCATRDGPSCVAHISYSWIL